jgi:hypothetical protein
MGQLADLCAASARSSTSATRRCIANGPGSIHVTGQARVADCKPVVLEVGPDRRLGAAGELSVYGYCQAYK